MVSASNMSDLLPLIPARHTACPARTSICARSGPDRWAQRHPRITPQAPVPPQPAGSRANSTSFAQPRRVRAQQVIAVQPAADQLIPQPGPVPARPLDNRAAISPPPEVSSLTAVSYPATGEKNSLGQGETRSGPRAAPGKRTAASPGPSFRRRQVHPGRTSAARTPPAPPSAAGSGPSLARIADYGADHTVDQAG